MDKENGMHEIRIENLADRRTLLPHVTAWCHGSFASAATPLQSVSDAIQEHIDAADAGKVWPFTLVAMLDDAPVGCVHGVESELDDQPHLQPFVAALFVQSTCRRMGIGSQLLLAAERECLRAGFDRAYLCAWSGERWYADRGWIVEQRNVGEKQVPLMAKHLDCQIHNSPKAR
jgi:GNAT superfamily N-acetyltransferase